MANVVPRPLSDGTVTYQVRWRIEGGRDGGGASETFTSQVRAEAFKLDVVEAGHHWPEGWVKGGVGHGSVDRLAQVFGDCSGSHGALSVPHAIVGGMGWADAIELALHVAPKWLATSALVALLAYVSITGDADPILWWIRQIADQLAVQLLPAFTAIVTPS